MPFVNLLARRAWSFHLGIRATLVVAVGAGGRTRGGDAAIAGDLKARDQAADRGDGFLAGPEFRRAQRRVVANLCCQER